MIIFTFVSLIWLLNQLFKSLIVRHTISHNARGSSADEIAPSVSVWNQLPDEVADYIFAKLRLEDRVRMMSVCKSWRQTLMQDHIPVAPEPPWRITSQDSYSRPEYSLHNMCLSSFDGKNYLFKLPFAGRWWCCGASGGWLLMAGCDWDENLEEDVEIILWNPISGAIRRLPALSTVPLFSDFIGHGLAQGIESISPFIRRVHVFSVESAECVVAAIFVDPTAEPYIYEQEDPTENPYSCFAVCTPQEQSWSVVDVEGINVFHDICFHNGKLYASFDKWDDLEGNETIRRETKRRIVLKDCDVEVNVLCLMYDGGFGEGVLRYHRDGLDKQERYVVEEHLVSDMMSGQVLVVSAIRDLWFNIEEDPIKSFKYSQTSAFEVRRLVESSDCLEKVDGIGEQAIFVGSKSALVSPAQGIEASNCIYFATNDARGSFIDQTTHLDDLESYRLDDCYRFREEGVFDLEQKSIDETFLTSLRMQSGSTTGWFTPKLFLT